LLEAAFFLFIVFHHDWLVIISAGYIHFWLGIIIGYLACIIDRHTGREFKKQISVGVGKLVDGKIRAGWLGVFCHFLF